MQLEVSSSRHGVHVKMNGAKIYEDYAEGESTRGVHVIVLNEVNGATLARRVFDMYLGGMEVEGLTNFLSIVRDGRIVIFAIKVGFPFYLICNHVGNIMFLLGFLIMD